MGRCRDLHAELDKERGAGNLAFAELEAWVGKIWARDRFGAPLRGEVERELKACREDLEAFAASVYEAADLGSADSS